MRSGLSRPSTRQAIFFALPYGPSSTAPDNDVRAFERYFERLEQAGLGTVKRPDLLIFRKEAEQDVDHLVAQIGGVQELPFTPEDHPTMQALIARAILAVECENSLWIAKHMPDYGSPLKPQRRLGGKEGLKKSAVLPTVILKEEDRSPLVDWQQQRGLPIHIWHVFFDVAFGISLNRVETLITDGYIEPTIQTFQSPGGATSQKILYKIYYHYAYLLGESLDEPDLVADYIKDKNGHILPYVKFTGGRLKMSQDVLDVLNRMS